ncbi:MAG TPA: ATP-binding protein [Burkholderiales bacterium]
MLDARDDPALVRDDGGAEVMRERCDFIYRRAWHAVGATLVLSILLSACLWRLRPTELILTWQGLVILCAAAFAALALAYRRAKDSNAQPDWVRRAAFGAAALGASWGFAAAVFFPGGQDEQPLIAFVVALVAAGGIPLFSTVWWVYAIYAAAIVLPFMVVLFAHGTASLQLFGAVVPLFYLASVATAWQLAKVFTSAYGVRSAYRKLSDENADIQTQLGEQLDSLLEAHREVQAYGRKLTLFSERAPIAVIETDARGTMLELNPAAENLFGWAASEMLGRNVVTMLLGGDNLAKTEDWWRGFTAAGKPETLVVEECLRRDGLALSCEWTLTPLLNEEGRVSSVVLHGRDITQQRASERVRSEFTSTLSHELRTPLTSILGSLQLMRTGILGDLSKDMDEMTEIAEKNSKRLLDLINEVLDIEKIESGRMSLTPEPVALDELLREAVQLNQGFADRFSVKLAIAGELTPVTVRADRKRLMQVVTNLLSNAAKFSPPNGAVEISVARRDGRVKVGVGDRGPGIPEAFRGRIFGRFAQAHSADARIKGGSGLGLAISKRLVELMQGEIGFEDRPGGGTTFFFELPVLMAAESDAAGPVRILITEQDTVAAEYMAIVLEKAGYRVDSVPNAKDSRVLLARWQYGCWLLDTRLPDAADALALVDELREQLHDTRIVMLASIGTDRDGASQAGERGVVDWLAKNDSREHILDVVARALGQTPAPQAAA